MRTRNAAARAAAPAAKRNNIALTLSSPPSTPVAVRSHPSIVPDGDVFSAGQDVVSTPIQALTPPEPVTRKRKVAATKRKRDSKTKKPAVPVKGDWDVLPHGLGKKGDLEELDASDTKDVFAKSDVLGGNSTGSLGILKTEIVGNGPRSSKRKSIGNDRIDSKDTAAREDTELPKVKRVKIEATNDAKTEVVEAKVKVVKTEEDIKIEKGVKTKDPKTKTKEPKVKEPKVKKHPYGLTPGKSPYPGFEHPTPEECYEVHRLLTDLHGEVKAPKEIPPPSTDVTGCGEVPDLLDALLRTLLSAATTNGNSNKALQGLKNTFGLATEGVHKGSINWEAVRQADLKTVIGAIKCGGLANMKGKNIKKILDAVYERNLSRFNALMGEKKTGEAADLPGATHESQHQKDTGIMRFKNNMLSFDYLFELTSEEVMDELTKLPGIGVKTSSCVLLFCMKRPSFAVDTHVYRLCKWLGWVPEKATRDSTFSHGEVKIPNDLKYGLHQLFIKHGKTCPRCKAGTGPGSEGWNTANCPIEHLVKRSGLMKDKERKKSKGKKLKELESDDEAENDDEVAIGNEDEDNEDE